MTQRPQRTFSKGTVIAAAVLLSLALLAFWFDSAVDQNIRAFSHRVGKEHLLQDILFLIRPLGKGDILLSVALLLGIGGYRRRLLHILLGLILVTILVWPLKLIVGRERPNKSNAESFPSGDTATVSAFCLPLLNANPWTGSAAGILITAVAAGRVYDGKHFPSDVLVGAAVGLCAGMLAMVILRRSRYRKIPWRRGWLLMALIAWIAVCLVLHFGYGKNELAVDFLCTWFPALLLLTVSRIAPVLCRKYAATALMRWRQPAWRWIGSGLLLAAILGVYVYTATRSSLWDRDEPRFAKATLEMIQSGNYLFPTFNGDLRPDKPILIYWLMSIAIRLLGITELACRLWAPIGTICACILTFWLGVRLFSPLAGGLAALALATTPLMMVAGTAATTDAWLLTCIVATLAVFAHALIHRPRLYHGILMGVTLGAALLTKGPVGFVLPILVILATLFFARSIMRPLRDYGPPILLALAIGAGLFLLWALPANMATHGEFLRQGIGHHVVARTVHPLESHGGKTILFFFYYFPILLITFFPWTLYLPGAISVLAGTHWPTSGDWPRHFILGWILPILLLMSLVATKLPHYVLPCWPAMALLVAGVMTRTEKELTARDRRWLKSGPWLFVPVGLALALILLALPWLYPWTAIRIPAFSTVAPGLIMLCTTGMGWHLFRRRQHAANAFVLSAGMLFFMLSLATLLLPALESFKVSRPIAQAICARTTSAVPVATFKYGEPSLAFYLNRSPIESLGEAADVRTWSQRTGEGILVIPTEKLRTIESQGKPMNLVLLRRMKGYNYSKGQAVEIMALYRRGKATEPPRNVP